MKVALHNIQKVGQQSDAKCVALLHENPVNNNVDKDVLFVGDVEEKGVADGLGSEFYQKVLYVYVSLLELRI